MMRMVKHIARIVLSAVLPVAVVAQDVQFSQPYSTPLFLNPAFAGSTEGSRFSLNYRNQWPGVEHNYRAMGAGYDQRIKSINGGLGVTFVRDVAGIHKLSNTMAAIQYSQHLAINRKSSMSLGVQAGFGQRRFDDSNLFFADQVINQSSTSLDAQKLFPGNQFADLSAGLMYYRDDFWIGASLHHINQPNQSLLGELDVLPRKFSVHGGWILPIKQFRRHPAGKHVRLLFNFKSQGKWDQLDLGGYYSVRGINLGMWYRGIPFKPYQPGYQNNESLVLLAGYEFKNGLSIGYSYDLTLSRLAGHSGGAHEVAIIFETSKRKKKTRPRIIPCAKF